MRRLALALMLLVALAVGACGGDDDDDGGGGGSADAPAKLGKEKVTITAWTAFTARELKVFKGVIQDFEAEYPNVTVKVQGAIGDDKIIAAMRSGDPPDVAHSFTTDNVGNLCQSGAWIDLSPYIERDGVDLGKFPEAVRTYTQYEGNQCTLPMLADAYGLYYNNAMFKEAGLSEPPKTMSELTEYAKKLTKRSADGKIEVAGYNPTFGWYENTASHYAPLFGAKWLDDEGKAAFANGGWDRLLEWQTELVDWYGADELKRFTAGLGDEWTPSNAFQQGKVAMHLDGEWRTAFIAADAPKLEYGTAPLPVDDEQAGLYGAGHISGSILGVPKKSDEHAAAWELVKYLTTDTAALAKLAQGVRNVPTTPESLEASGLHDDEHFGTFLDIMEHSASDAVPSTAAGSEMQELFDAFLEKAQYSDGSDFGDGLSESAEQVDAALAQSGEGSDVP